MHPVSLMRIGDRRQFQKRFPKEVSGVAKLLQHLDSDFKSRLSPFHLFMLDHQTVGASSPSTLVIT